MEIYKSRYPLCSIESRYDNLVVLKDGTAVFNEPHRFTKEAINGTFALGSIGGDVDTSHIKEARLALCKYIDKRILTKLRCSAKYVPCTDIFRLIIDNESSKPPRLLADNTAKPILTSTKTVLFDTIDGEYQLMVDTGNRHDLQKLFHDLDRLSIVLSSKWLLKRNWVQELWPKTKCSNEIS